MRYTGDNGANNVADCPHFSCQTVEVRVLTKCRLIEGFLRDSAVWMKGLCTDLIKTQCSNYCSSVCDKWDCRERKHTHTGMCAHTATKTQLRHQKKSSGSQTEVLGTCRGLIGGFICPAWVKVNSISVLKLLYLRLVFENRFNKGGRRKSLD